MPIHFIHAPYMKESRDKLLELQQQGSDIIYTERWKASDDDRYDFTKENHDANYVSFLPSMLLVDDDHKTVLARAEKLEHMTHDNIQWMHQAHAQWKQNGRAGKFPVPPWKEG